MTLKNLFEIALAISGMTNQSFADQNGVTEAAVRRVAAGNLKSHRLNTAIKSFIQEQFKKLNIQCPALQEIEYNAQNEKSTKRELHSQYSRKKECANV